MTEYWLAPRCAQEWDVDPDTWYEYVRTGRAPRPAATKDPVTGQLRWRADDVLDYPRPGQGARTDLVRIPAPDGELVTLTDDAADMAELLLELATPTRSRLLRSQVREAWLRKFPEDGDTKPRGPARAHRETTKRADGRRASKGTRAKFKISNSLGRLVKLGLASRHGGGQAAMVEVLDRDGLWRVIQLVDAHAKQMQAGADGVNRKE